MAEVRRKVVDEQEARALLGAVARSGSTLKAWANQHGIDGRSLHMWQVNLERSASGGEPALRLVELVAPQRPTSRYVVRLGDDIAIEVDDGFHDDTLRRLLAVLSC